ncbi:MAG: hypothetical protein QOE23_1802 [Pseudonocardiales bacterium]|jgi:hypothetical protein|nr:hypothetical protein [Pseudonocardiales bacterium]
MDRSVDTDEALVQLKKLREGIGLTADRLQDSGAVMSALGASDPQIALHRLQQLLRELGDGERIRALRVDFGLDLEELLERTPHARERDWLGDRRAGYAKAIGRDVKTLGRWSDRTVAELRAKLLTDQFTGHLIVAAAVEGDRILGTTTIQRPLDTADDEPATHISTGYPNVTPGPSMPCLIYGYPRDWKPATLTLAVVFKRPPYPQQAWAVSAPNFFELVYATDRHELPVDGDTITCRFERPRTDRLYGIWWTARGAEAPSTSAAPH